jgi:hypothetical protein
VVNLKVADVQHHGIPPMTAEQKQATAEMLQGFAKREKQAREVAAVRPAFGAVLHQMTMYVDHTVLCMTRGALAVCHSYVRAL